MKEKPAIMTVTEETSGGRGSTNDEGRRGKVEVLEEEKKMKR